MLSVFQSSAFQSSAFQIDTVNTPTITFDGVNRLIILSETTTVAMQQIFRAWIDWINIPENTNYPDAISYTGGNPYVQAPSLGTTLCLTNGWRIRPMERDHTLYFFGNLYTEPIGSSPFTHTLGAFNVVVEMSASSLIYFTPSLTDEQNNKLMALPDAATIAAQVDTVMAPRFSTIQPGLTPQQETMLMEIYSLMGLDPTKPLLVAQDSRTAGGEIVQTIAIDEISQTTTVTRDPNQGVPTGVIGEQIVTI